MKSTLLVAAAVLISAAPVSPTRGDEDADRSQIQKLTDQMVTAQQRNDVSAIEALLADDFVAIHSDGAVANKAQEMAAFRSGAQKNQKVDVRDVKIRLYGDTAVVNISVSYRGTLGGKPNTGDLRNTRIWIRRQGDWKCVMFQATRVLAAKTAS